MRCQPFRVRTHPIAGIKGVRHHCKQFFFPFYFFLFFLKKSSFFLSYASAWEMSEFMVKGRKQYCVSAGFHSVVSSSR